METSKLLSGLGTTVALLVLVGAFGGIDACSGATTGPTGVPESGSPLVDSGAVADAENAEASTAAEASSSDGGDVADATADADATSDAAADAADATEGGLCPASVDHAFPPCGDGKLCCFEGCVDVVSDPNHCGSCFNVCSPSQTCHASVCVP